MLSRIITVKRILFGFDMKRIEVDQYEGKIVANYFLPFYSVISPRVLYSAAALPPPVKFPSIIHPVPPSFPVGALSALAPDALAPLSSDILRYRGLRIVSARRENGCTCAALCPRLVLASGHDFVF